MLRSAGKRRRDDGCGAGGPVFAGCGMLDVRGISGTPPDGRHWAGVDDDVVRTRPEGPREGREEMLDQHREVCLHLSNKR
jgi:hypothetical protein